MQALSEIEVNRKLLAEVEEILKGKNERLFNIKSRVDELKQKLIQNVDAGRWDEAVAILDQTHKLAVDGKAAEEDVIQAQARVDSLVAAIKRAEEKARLDAMKPTYVPYAPETAKPESVTVTAPEKDGAEKA
jgi:oligoendopeptidase F